MTLPDLVIHPLVVRTVTVTEVETLPGRVRRVHLGGEELRAFTRDGLTHPAFAAPGFDDHIKLIFAADGDVASALPRQHPDGIEWTPSEHRLTRDYTPHSVNPETGGFQIDFVLHGDGPAARWAASAVPGSPLSFVGPKSSLVLPGDVTSIVLIGDATALPAIRRFLADRPTAVPAHVVVLAEDRSVVSSLPQDSAASISLERIAGGEDIAQAAERLLARSDLGDRPFLWAAAEAGSLLPLRRRLTGRVGKRYRSITGYWHATDDHVAHATEPTLPPSPVAWLTVRAALDLGLLAALEERPRTTAELEHDLAVAASLEPLLGGLAAQGMVEAQGPAGVRGLAGPGGERWCLTAIATELLDDPHEVEEFSGPEASQILALQHLAESVRTGRSAWEISYGQGFAESARTDPALADHLEHESESLVYLQHGLLRVLDGLDSPDTVVVGPAAELVVGLAAAGGRETIRVTASDPEPRREAAVAVSAMLLGHLDDDAARAHLRGLAALAPRALVVDAIAPDGLSPAAAEENLLRFAVTAAPSRSPERVAELARPAGWIPVRATSLGWGVVAAEFTLIGDASPAR